MNKNKTIMYKRVYDIPSPKDGTRVLVDRLWPRGLSRKKAVIDQWVKDIAPSTSLRKWFGHEPARFNEFARRYHLELDAKQQFIVLLEALAIHNDITLVYAARDKEFNHAIILAQYLREKMNRKAPH